MKRIFVERLHRHVVLGACKLVQPHPKAPRLAHVAAKCSLDLSSPAAVAWNNAAAMQVIANVEGNDSVGDCVEAEEAHFIALATANGKGLFAYTPAMTLAMYSALTGYVPGNASTDQGTDPFQCLQYFTSNPYADGTTNKAFLVVDATNQAEVRYALATFGNLKLWLGLPDVYINPFPSTNGFVWDVAPADQNNGHCIGACGYLAGGQVPPSVKVLGCTAQGVVVMTWGLVGILTWAALAVLCSPPAGGGCATRVTTDWLNANGTSPTGQTIAQLMAEYNALPQPVTT